MSPRSDRALAAVLLVLVVATSCATSSVLPPQPAPVLEPIGDGVVRYGGSEVWVAVDYRFARLSAGERWLLLDVGVTGADNRSATVERSRVFVRSPAGRRYPLASQREVAEGGQELANLTRRADVLGKALPGFPGSREPCRFDFFIPRGVRRGVAFDQVFVNDSRACFERLHFPVPDGVEPGRWVLGLDLERSEVRVPFELP
jgi:hypothetical protein